MARLQIKTPTPMSIQRERVPASRPKAGEHNMYVTMNAIESRPMSAFSGLNPKEVYPPGTNPATMDKDPNATEAGKERIERKPGQVEVWATLKRSNYKPDQVFAKKGDKVILHLTNIETTPDATHGFAIPRYNINCSLDPGEVTTVQFTADAPGAFAFYCTEFCSALHLEMQGWLMVTP